MSCGSTIDGSVKEVTVPFDAIRLIESLAACRVPHVAVGARDQNRVREQGQGCLGEDDTGCAEVQDAIVGVVVEREPDASVGADARLRGRSKPIGKDFTTVPLVRMSTTRLGRPYALLVRYQMLPSGPTAISTGLFAVRTTDTAPAGVTRA